MALRRMFIQLGIIAGGLTFFFTLWRALSRWELDIFQASVRAVIAGIAVLLCSLLILGIIEKLGGQNQ